MQLSLKSAVFLFVLPVLAHAARPAGGTTCFSPDQPCGQLLTDFVSGADKSLDIAIYDISLKGLVDEIIAKARQSGVSVRVLVDRRQARADRHSQVATLLRAGVKVEYGSQRGIMHDKFVIVDGREVETGSFNDTYSAARYNSENQVYLTDPAVVQAFEGRFNKLWRRGRLLR